MRRKAIPVLLVLILLAALSCSTFKKNTYVVLSESKDFYDLAMTSVSKLQTDGLIKPEQRAAINQVAKIYKEAHNAAVDALLVYEKTKLAGDKDKVIVALAEAAKKWGQVANLINAIKPGTVPATFSQ